MRKTLLILFGFLLSFVGHAQSLLGAWENYAISEEGEKLKKVIIFADGYHVLTTYNATSGEFIRTIGGAWNIDNSVLTKTLEFHTDTPEFVGTEISSKITLTADLLKFIDEGTAYTRIDNGKPGALQGAWLMSGRVVDGETQIRDTSGPRKTMKILSGTRFQWIAYNTATKQFMATGGGTYSTIDGEYTERIEFFSRDNTRAGQSLKFDYDLVDGNWHHSGLSSKGNPIYEIWSERK